MRWRRRWRALSAPIRATRTRVARMIRRRLTVVGARVFAKRQASTGAGRRSSGGSAFYLHCEDAGDGFADFGAVGAVQREGELGFHQAVGDAGVVALAVGDDGPVL